ncbi:hypothetical protein VVT58_00305 [Sphingobium sp. SJ10-10]|nr:hypothetical protein [Sphingobium sp. SJ10-10]
MDIGQIYYFGESVLLLDWRGRGIGHAFSTSAKPRHGNWVSP